MGELEGVGGYGMVGLNGTGSCDFWGKVEVGNGQTRHEIAHGRDGRELGASYVCIWVRIMVGLDRADSCDFWRVGDIENSQARIA